MSETADSPAPPRARLERAHALLLLLPAAWLAWPGPGAPLAGDLLPELSGAGWAALCAIPAGIALVARGAFVHAPLVWLYVGFLGAGAASHALSAPTDTLEASRAALLGLATAVTLAGGAGLWNAGRRRLAGGLVALALLAALPALASEGLAGALGNTAGTSELALPGALAAALLWSAVGSTTARLACAAAVVAFGLHAGRAPVLSTALVFGLVLVAAWLGAPRDDGGRARRRRLALALALGVLSVIGGRELRPEAPVTDAGPTTGGAAGVSLRASIARASLDLLGTTPWIGVGPGQFAATFPPHRELVEIEASTFGRRVRETTEVEHAHDDWLHGVVETGLFGGVFWIAFLLASAWRSLRALRGGVWDAALGAAALGLLAEAGARGPLLSNPASATVAFALFGALLAPPVDARERGTAMRVGMHAALLLLAINAPRAAAVIRHGRDLARRSDDARTPSARAVQAMEDCGDSVLARSLYARFAPREASGTVDELGAWQRVLELRPHRFEALMEVGNAYARAGRLEEAREAYTRARALDPGEPFLLRNLATLEVRARDVAAALEIVARLEADGRLPAGWLDDATVDALGRLDLEGARALLAHAHPDWGTVGGQAAWDRAQTLEETHPALSRALEGLAHLEWAREQIAAGDAATGVRSYRQAVRGLATLSDDPAVPSRVDPTLRLELAAALLRAGRPDEATQEADRARPGVLDLARLPAWAGDELLRAGLLGR